MSSDDEFDDLFSFSSPAKATTKGTAGATDASADDDDFLDDVFGPSSSSSAGAAATTTTATATGDVNDDSFLDIFDSPGPSEGKKATAATATTGTTTKEDIEAEFDFLTADVGSATGSRSSSSGGADANAPTTNANANATTSTCVGTAAEAVLVAAAEAPVSTDTGDASVLEKQEEQPPAKAAPAPAPVAPAPVLPASTSVVEQKQVTVPAPDKTSVTAETKTTAPKESISPQADEAPPSAPIHVPRSAVPAAVEAPAKAPAPASASASASVTSTTATDASQPNGNPATVPAAPTVVKAPAPAPASAPLPSPSPATQPPATLLHPDDDFHVHDAETREMLDFLEPSDPTNTTTPAVTDGADARNANDNDEDDDDDDGDDFGAFAKAESVAVPSSSSTPFPSGGVLSEGHTVGEGEEEEDGAAAAFDFEKDILGVVPTEEEIAEKKAKEEKEKKAAAAAAEAAARKKATTADTSDIRSGTISMKTAPTKGSDTAANKMSSILGGPAKSVGTPSVASFRNISFSSKLANPLRRKTQSQGEKEKEKEVPSLPSPTEDNLAEKRSGTAASEGVEETKAAKVPTTATARMGSLLHSIKTKTADAKASVASGADAASAKAQPNASVASPPKPNTTASPPKLPPLPPPITFESVSDAVRSPKSSASQIRDMVNEEQEKAMRGGGWAITEEDRPSLWVKLITGKTLDDVAKSSLVEAFTAWDKSFSLDSLQRQLGNDEEKTNDSTTTTTDDDSLDLGNLDPALLEKVLSESKSLADRADREGSFHRDLCSLVLFHRRSTANAAAASEKDPYLASVVAVLLAASIPSPVISLLLANISSAFPLMGLSEAERATASRKLHEKLYAVSSYNIPILVGHLDRHVPGWWTPKQEGDDGTKDDSEKEVSKRKKETGCLPMSWFVSHCAASDLDLSRSLLLWDSLLAGMNSSLPFFLALATLEAAGDELLMLHGVELEDKLCSLMNVCSSEDSGMAIGSVKESNINRHLAWLEKAKLLEESTPTSVVSDLRTAEDSAVATALARRREAAEERIKAAEAKAQAEQRKKRQDDAKKALIKSRLTQYYRRNQPSKIDSVDRILEVYDGRYDVLDKNLKAKYGHGFLPQMPSISVNPQLSTSTSKLLSSVKDQKAKIAEKVESAARKQQKKKQVEDDQEGQGFGGLPVCVRVQAPEVIRSIVCSTPSKMNEVDKDKSPESLSSIKFYLVDSREEEMQREQGKFPTSISLSPKSLMDPEKMEEVDSLFESLRGAAHICIVGAGYSKYKELYPTLYGHNKLSEAEKALAREDESRTSLAALFFVKKGFPYVSILDGGMAAAHTWLSREGDRNISPQRVLVNYDSNTSTFAELEALQNATASERTQKNLQKMLDKSMTALTLSEQAIEKKYSMATSAESRSKAKESLSNLISKGRSSMKNDESQTARGDSIVASESGAGDGCKSEQHGMPSISLKAMSARFGGKTDAMSKSGPPVEEKKDESATSSGSSSAIAEKIQKFKISSSSAKTSVDPNENKSPPAESKANEANGTVATPIDVPPTKSKFHFLVSTKPAGTGTGKGGSSTADEARKTAIGTSSAAAAFGAAKASFGLKMTSLDSKLKSKMKTKSEPSGNSTDRESEEESITFHTEGAGEDLQISGSSESS